MHRIACNRLVLGKEGRKQTFLKLGSDIQERSLVHKENKLFQSYLSTELQPANAYALVKTSKTKFHFRACEIMIYMERMLCNQKFCLQESYFVI